MVWVLEGNIESGNVISSRGMLYRVTDVASESNQECSIESGNVYWVGECRNESGNVSLGWECHISSLGMSYRVKKCDIESGNVIVSRSGVASIRESFFMKRHVKSKS